MLAPGAPRVRPTLRRPCDRVPIAGTFRVMGTQRHLALLRGINVGGRNKVAMAELRGAFEDGGYQAVQTYIQTGNVLFDHDSERPIEDDVEAMLERRFGFPLVVVLRSDAELRNVVDDAPAGFGARPDLYHSDAIFLKAPLSSQEAMGVVDLRGGVDEAWPGNGVLYFARLSERRAQSRMSRIVGTPEYQQMTIRSWGTTVKLLGLLTRDGAQGASGPPPAG